MYSETKSLSAYSKCLSEIKKNNLLSYRVNNKLQAPKCENTVSKHR